MKNDSSRTKGSLRYTRDANEAFADEVIALRAKRERKKEERKTKKRMKKTKKRKRNKNIKIKYRIMDG